ncbi:MAG: hypothetical protein M3314_05650 [Actinomycetota bacterium]|nr:hypothetical protein [Actinomycetota bacterium]
MNPTVARPRRPQSRTLGQGLLAVAGIAALAAGVLVTTEATRLPSFVPRLSVINPTPYDVEIDVARPAGPGWLNLGGVRRESIKRLYEVIDQGERWVFRFRYAGREAGEMTVRAQDLRASGWQVAIPAEVGDRLRAAGLSPSA